MLWEILQRKWNFNIINNFKKLIMDLKSFIENFAEQFDETDASVFTPETVFHELDEYSSLIALSIIAMVDEEYDVTLKGDDMRAAVTIQDLFNTVQAKAQ